MKQSNVKANVCAFRGAAALITAALLTAALLFTGCSNGSDSGGSGGGGTPPTPKHEVTFGVDGENGTLKAKVDGSEIHSGAAVEEGKTVTFTAVPAAGYRVKGWMRDGEAVNGHNNSYSFPVAKAVTVKVSFEDDSTPLPTHSVTFGVDGANGTLKAKVDGSEIHSGAAVPKDTVLVFTASPHADYKVEKWTVNGTVVTGNTSNTYEHTVTQAANIRVSFISSIAIPDEFTLTNGAKYEVVDKEQKHVIMTRWENGVDSTTVVYTVAVTVVHEGITYTLTGFSRGCIYDYLTSLNLLTAFALSGESAFLSVDGGVLFDKTKTKLICYPKGKTGTTYTVPTSVKVLGTGSFSENRTLTSIVLPEGLTTIEDYALYDCKNLQTVNIPSTLTSIGWSFLIYSKVENVVIPEGITELKSYSLYNCSSLKTVELPASLTQMGVYFCGHCTALETVTCKAPTPPTLERSNAFNGVTLSGVTLKVPSSDAYQVAEVWGNFGTITAITP